MKLNQLNPNRIKELSEGKYAVVSSLTFQVVRDEEARIPDLVEPVGVRIEMEVHIPLNNTEKRTYLIQWMQSGGLWGLEFTNLKELEERYFDDQLRYIKRLCEVLNIKELEEVLQIYKEKENLHLVTP